MLKKIKSKLNDKGGLNPQPHHKNNKNINQ